jgi:hypothetical protein
MENKQTAVELLVEQVFGENTNYYLQWKLEIDQALEMEKEQIKNAWMDGKYLFKHSSSEQYYNETYKKEE